MKKTIKTWLMGLLCAHLTCQYINAELTITFFIKPEMPHNIISDIEKLKVLLRTPGKMNLKILKKYLHTGTYDGVFATYMGQLAVSNMIGEIRFIRQQKEPIFNFLITPVIEPVMMIDRTVHHWELLPNVPAKMYRVVKVQEPTTKMYYWHTQKAELPEDNIITLNTIVIFSYPKNISMDIGNTLARDSQQFVLPPLYAKKELNVAANAVRLLKTKHFFGPIKELLKKQTDTYYSSNIIN